MSIGPVLAVPGVRDAMERFDGPRIAVSPIVGGKALKGPADKMMTELGEDVSNTGVARRYAGICDTLVIDVGDAHEAASVEQVGMSVHVAPTVMTSDAEKVALAEEIACPCASSSARSGGREARMTEELPHWHAVIPMKPLAEAKSRLAASLPPLARHALVLMMLQRVVTAVLGGRGSLSVHGRGR